jgi:hypothetical protein
VENHIQSTRKSPVSPSRIRQIKAGICAPTFRLWDHRGLEVASETLLRHRPLLLTFYTGSWCPACSRDLQAFESLRPSIEARGASEHLAAHDHRERRNPRAIEAAHLAEEYSIADVGAFTWVNFAMPTIRSNAGNALGGTPAVDRWLGEINSRPGVQRGLRAAKVVIGKGRLAS